jgi:hypothetical protein
MAMRTVYVLSPDIVHSARTTLRAPQSDQRTVFSQGWPKTRGRGPLSDAGFIIRAAEGPGSLRLGCQHEDDGERIGSMIRQPYRTPASIRKHTVAQPTVATNSDGTMRE